MSLMGSAAASRSSSRRWRCSASSITASADLDTACS
jgi:hypothetical protein